jgi:hypothetical protein
MGVKSYFAPGIFTLVILPTIKQQLQWCEIAAFKTPNMFAVKVSMWGRFLD